ncbi:MAG: FGGY-family carbohydrate kinase [Candidatus Caldatribacteriaceae bacterium]
MSEVAAYLLGIDYGTGGGKACVIDASGRVLAYAFREYPIIVQKPGWSEHDPNLYWKVACEMVQECLAKAKIDPHYIRGIAVSSALPNLVMVDENGDPIGLAYNLMDRRATEEVKWLKTNIGEDQMFALTGNPVDDHPMLVNLLWEKRNRPDVFRRIRWALTVDGFINLKLTGRPTVNIGSAAFYGVAWDIRQHRFSEDILREIGIPRDIFPPAFACDKIIGEVTKEAEEIVGIPAGTPVCAGAVDFCVSCVASGTIEEGDIQMNLGTCGNFGVVHRSTDFLKEMLVCPHAVESRSTYVTIPTTMTGGQLLRYIRDNLSHFEVDVERTLGISSYDLLNLEAEKVSPGSEGLVALPYLMGERTPIWDPNARAVLFGLSLSHTKGHIVRAFMESVAYALYHNFEIIKNAGWKTNFPIVFNEGGARSRPWRQIITDVFNIPTVFLKNRAGAPYGGAILAGVATRVLPGFQVAKEWAKYVDRLEPSPEHHALYREYYRLYRRLYEHLKEDFRELARLRNISTE